MSCSSASSISKPPTGPTLSRIPQVGSLRLHTKMARRFLASRPSRLSRLSPFPARPALLPVFLEPGWNGDVGSGHVLHDLQHFRRRRHERGARLVLVVVAFLRRDFLTEAAHQSADTG